ncbi:MAG: YraN family protein [Desulfosarcinaceae bacterium]|nr:YraN family protein [Desulfosarcinaceae bacterium]
MLNPAQWFGRSSEAVAARFLRKQGYRILALNYRNRFGEIDIVAEEGDTLVFVEVKARHDPALQSPKAAVTPRKQRKIVQVAQGYLKTGDHHKRPIRFDVVAISAHTAPPQVELIRHAFDATS